MAPRGMTTTTTTTTTSPNLKGFRYDSGLVAWRTLWVVLLATTTAAGRTCTSSVFSPFACWAFQPTYPTYPTLHRATNKETNRQQTRLPATWFPKKSPLYDDDIFAQADATAELQERAVTLTARLIRHRLQRQPQPLHDDGTDTKVVDDDHQPPWNERIGPLVRGRFRDLTGTPAGERVLEQLYWPDDDALLEGLWNEANDVASVTGFAPEDAIRASVMVLQSLCLMGTQVGVKGVPEQLQRLKAHLDPVNPNRNNNRGAMDIWDVWNSESIRQLKYNLDRTPALALASELSWKQTPLAIFDLLVQLGAWDKHEDLALLRSGFPIRFTDSEEQAVVEALERKESDHVLDADPDTILGLRQDLRHHKVYTVDSVSTSEIDDGLSVEIVERVNENGESATRHRIWIHIADADRWAPRDSELFEAARRRITSLYLPRGSIPMFPPHVAQDVMSLNVNEDVCALSLGVELNDDGSVDQSSLVVTPSLIRVAYRLSYDEVDEMLEEGIAYNEEWQLGALLAAATKRRQFRVRNGSQEGLIPSPVPSGSVSAFSDKHAPDGVGISLNIQVSHNAAKNKTATAEDGPSAASNLDVIVSEPVSSAYLLVTEAMILAGEAIGRFQSVIGIAEETRKKEGDGKFENWLRLPFRSQRKPDFKSRSRERKYMMELLEYYVGHGFCHAWYARRFLNSVSITESVQPHSGLGLECYVQWSSPIRRFSDLQVHAAVKRYLRRQRIYKLHEGGHGFPKGITARELGLPDNVLDSETGMLTVDAITTDMLDQDIDYMEGAGLVGAARTLQRQSQQYWLFEYIQRHFVKNRNKIYNAIILGCVDPEKQQYAIYLKELGLEHRYSAPGGNVKSGDDVQLKVDQVSPRSGILRLVRVV